jgi:hypothetical protein
MIKPDAFRAAALSGHSLSLGWMFRDGLALLASAVVGSGAVAFALAFGHLLWEGVRAVGLWLGLGA